MAGLSTHVLDTVNGCPAAGVRIEVLALDAGQPRLLSTAVTNSDGRTDAPVVAPENLKAGIYELVFHIGDYFANGTKPGALPYLTTVPIRVGVADPGAHYHVALLVSPWSYTTYRGS
jgi:5-hydroxyisourate hydrolase